MSEERFDLAEDLKGSRRSRKDEHGRDYICGCGKKYLSYPALYTHIKTKHNGNQPEGTQKTTGLPNKGRARPKIDERVLKQVQTEVTVENMKILEQLGEDGRGQVQANDRVRKQLAGKQIWEAYLQIIKGNSSVGLIDKSALDTVLAVYLLAVGQYVSEVLLKYYNTFCRLFRNCFYDHLEDIFEAYGGDETNRIKKVTNQYCKYAPIIGDYFIRFYAPSEVADPDEVNIIELLTYDLCKWMHCKRLTEFKVTMTKDYEAMNKKMVEAMKDRRVVSDKFPAKKASDDIEMDDEMREQHLSSQLRSVAQDEELDRVQESDLLDL